MQRISGRPLRALLEAAYREALSAVSPARLLEPHLGGPRPDLIVAFGKASLPMARAALGAYPDVPTLVIPPAGTTELAAPVSAEVMPAAHPIPDRNSVLAAEEVLRRVSALQEGQEVLVLVSGGGSALLCAPDGVSLEQKRALTRELLRAGATIGEINAVRKHLSRTKGGRLAQGARANIRALLLSDVVGDDPAVIASGPTVPDPTTFADALAVLDKYKLDAPEARKHFQSGALDTPKALPNVSNTIIGSNHLLLAAAQRHLQAQGVRAVILGDTFEGEAQALAGFHASVIRSIQRHGEPFHGPLVLLSGGEATVTLPPNCTGIGGRNQEFALALALALGEQGVYALSAGSDGIDGSSPAAGTFLTPDMLQRAKALGLDAPDFLVRHDSGSFFARLGDDLVTGPSGHNLNDFRAIWVEPTADLSGSNRPAD